MRRFWCAHRLLASAAGRSRTPKPHSRPIPRSQESRGTAPPGTKAAASWHKSPHSWWVSFREAGSRSRPWAGSWWRPPSIGRRSRGVASSTFCTCRSSSDLAPPCNTWAARKTQRRCEQKDDKSKCPLKYREGLIQKWTSNPILFVPVYTDVTEWTIVGPGTFFWFRLKCFFV